MATMVSDGVPELEPMRPAWLSVPIGLALLGCVCLAIDVPVAAYFQSGAEHKLLRELFENAEPFGHGMGVALIVLAVFVLDASRRNWTGALLLGSLGSGLIANLVKLLVTRTRPRNLDLAESTVWETFGPWFPLAGAVGGDSHSFPSAHTATATGLAVVLTAMYPQGRWLFFGLATLTGLQRIESSAHFPSDVCFGAVAGWVTGWGVLELRRRANQRRHKKGQTAHE
jgi:membrane-associated phospholipid phosphatase